MTQWSGISATLSATVRAPVSVTRNLSCYLRTNQDVTLNSGWLHLHLQRLWGATGWNLARAQGFRQHELRVTLENLRVTLENLGVTPEILRVTPQRIKGHTPKN